MKFKWSQFRAFVEMCISEEYDATYRAYNLTAYGVKPATVRPAYAALSLPHTLASTLEIHVRLTNEGIDPLAIMKLPSINTLMVMWYNWQRLTDGYVRRWPFRCHESAGRSLSGTGQKEAPPARGRASMGVGKAEV